MSFSKRDVMSMRYDKPAQLDDILVPLFKMPMFRIGEGGSGRSRGGLAGLVFLVSFFQPSIGLEQQEYIASSEDCLQSCFLSSPAQIITSATSPLFS